MRSFKNSAIEKLQIKYNEYKTILFYILVKDILTEDGLLLPQQLPIAQLSLCCFFS